MFSRQFITFLIRLLCIVTNQGSIANLIPSKIIIVSASVNVKWQLCWQLDWCQFHQHFRSNFFVLKCFAQLSVLTVCGCYFSSKIGKKVACKMLVKLTTVESKEYFWIGLNSFEPEWDRISQWWRETIISDVSH